MRKRKIAIADFQISKKSKDNVRKVLESNRLTYGKFTEKFENDFSKIVGRKYVLFTNSGTSALQIALHALKEYYAWSDGDEVIVPAVTFIATTNIVIHNKLKPVFVDVEPDFYCIDVKKIEDKITKKTRAIIPVDLFGQSANMKSIMKIAKKYNLKILEDACEAMFASYFGKPVGSLSDISVFSTYVAHIIVTGVGGIITTNNQELAGLMKSLMFHGRDNIYLKMEDDDDLGDTMRLTSLIERRFQFHHVGYSNRITEMESALGLGELDRKEQIIEGRKLTGKRLTSALSEFSSYFQLPKIRPNCEHIYMLYPILIPDQRIEKEDFLLYLEKNGVETRLFMPLLSQPVYKKLFGDIEDKYPVAKRLVERGFIIGSHPNLTISDIDYVKMLFANYLRKIKIKK